MDTQTAPVETPAATPTPAPTPAPAETQTPTAPVAESLSLAEHEEKFGPKRNRARDTETGRFARESATPESKAEPAKAAPPTPADATEIEPEKRRRRETDVANRADAPRIAELTKQLRAEQRRREQVEAQLRDTVPAYTPPSAQPQPPLTGFPKKEPQPEDFANHADPYGAYLRAAMAWDREKADFEREQAYRAQTATQQHFAAAEGEFWDHFTTKADTFVNSTPDFEDVLRSAPHIREGMPDLLTAVILTDDNPGKLVYDLARDVALFDDATLWSQGWNVSEAAVSQLRRRLARRGLDRAATPSAATTSVAPTPVVTVVPTPPKVVKGGPMRSGDEPPGDDAPLSEHERVYGPKARNRRR